MTILNEVTNTFAEIDATWVLIGKALAVLTVIVGLWKAVEYLWSKLPIAKVDTRLKTAETRLEKGDKKFEELDRRIISIEEKVNKTQDQIKEVNRGIQMLGKAEVSLINHIISGNGVEDLKKEVKELTDFFIER